MLSASILQKMTVSGEGVELVEVVLGFQSRGGGVGLGVEVEVGEGPPL